MTVYIAQAYVAFDGGASNNAWAQGQAQWIKDNTQVLTGQALVVPGTAGERSSYCVVSSLGGDGTLTTISAWHVNSSGILVQGLPDGSGTPPTYPVWSSSRAYAVNDTVTYSGINYRCIQAHTSQVGWEPPNVGALWVAI
jgi:hypothetical protein